MGTELAQKADPAMSVTEGHQSFTQALHSHRGAIRLRKLAGKQGRQPITTNDFAHGSPFTGASQGFIVISGQHGVLSTLSHIGNSSRSLLGPYYHLAQDSDLSRWPGH